MILELIIFFILFLLVFILLSRRKLSFIDSIVESFSQTPISHDARLESLLVVAGKYYAEKNYLAAEKAYLKVLKVDHKNSLAYSRLGFIYSHFGQVDDAIECFQIVADTYPNSASYYNLAMLLFKNRKFKKAAKAMESSVSLEETPGKLVSLARIYRVLGDYSKQINALSKALKKEPDSSSIMLLLADSYLHNNQNDEAKEMFTKVLDIDPRNARAKQALNSSPLA